MVAIIRRQNQVIGQLQKQVEELQRNGKRQASPFSRNRPKGDPKRPGRKA
jgi:hypothetical protein